MDHRILPLVDEDIESIIAKHQPPRCLNELLAKPSQHRQFGLQEPYLVSLARKQAAVPAKPEVSLATN